MNMLCRQLSNNISERHTDDEMMRDGWQKAHGSSPLMPMSIDEPIITTEK
jgi:hypothetical protein